MVNNPFKNLNSASLNRTTREKTLTGTFTKFGRQVLKHAWAKGCFGVFGISGELSVHHRRNSSGYCNKPTRFSFSTNARSGQLLEAALGKGIALGGSLKYATPFSTPSVEAITNQLHRCGFSRWGSERVYNGRTGEMVESLVFIGPTFYQKLVHMSEDNVKFRNIGPVHPLTRQQVADRKRFGGVKFGKMERIAS